MRGGGVPYCPWPSGPWGEHGVCPFDEPLRAGGRNSSGHYVVVPALEDCTPNLRRGVVTVCRWGREVVVWGGVAGWCRGLFQLLRVVRVRWVVLLGWARRRCMVPRRVTLVPVSCVRDWPHSIGGIQTCWPWVCWRARQSTRSTMASWGPLPGVVRSPRALTVSLVQSSCRRYQSRGVLRALPWRVARRRSGSRMMVGVRGGCPGSGVGGLGGLPGSCASTLTYGLPWLGSAGLGGAGWLRGWRVGFGVLWWCLGGLWMEMGGVCGARSELVDVWVMHGMVMDETLHVFPGGWVGELFRGC